MTCPQCGLGPEAAHGRFVCAYRVAKVDASNGVFAFSHPALVEAQLWLVQSYTRRWTLAVEESDQVRTLHWWCVRNAWRWEQAMSYEDGCAVRSAIAAARHFAWSRSDVSSLLADGGSFDNPTQRAAYDVAPIAAARYAQACAEIVTNKETP